jgi:hypothetical protein
MNRIRKVAEAREAADAPTGERRKRKAKTAT